jgi:dTDP-4-amino-4,6-dideoxygalactose transaminase
LERWQEIQATRRRIWEFYDSHLADWAEAHRFRRPIVPPYCEQPYHMYYLIAPSHNFRTRLIDELKSQRILSVFHYQPLHLSLMGRAFGGREGNCPVSEDISNRVLRLPFFNEITSEQLERVVSAIIETSPTH